MNAKKWIVAVSLAVLIVLSFNLTTALAAPPSMAPGFYYTVRPGDTLYSIATRFGTTVWAVARANGFINPNLIFVGQVLFIPIAQPGPLPPVPPPAPGPVIHVVRPGETLASIARMYGVSLWSIAWANGIRNIHYIFAGQRLLIPTPTPVSGPVYPYPTYPSYYPWPMPYSSYGYGTPAGY